jgi:predicted dehydrogenase
MAKQTNLALATETDNPELNTEFTTGIGVIGAGYWGPKLARDFNKQDNTRVVAVCDVNPDKMRPFRALDPQIGCYGDYRDLLSNPKVKAVAISITDPARYVVANAALNNGLHVMVESYETASDAELKALKVNAEARGLKLAVMAFPNGGIVGGTLPEDVQTEMTNFLTVIQGK